MNNKLEMRRPPDTRRFGSLPFLLLALLSAGLISFCGLAYYSYAGVTDKPVSEQIKEQLSLPAVMPYDVEVFEPSGAAAATLALGGLLAVSGVFVLWNAWTAIVSMKSHSTWTTGPHPIVRHHRRAAGALVLFWVLGCILLANLIQVTRAYSHGIPPYG